MYRTLTLGKYYLVGECDRIRTRMPGFKGPLSTFGTHTHVNLPRLLTGATRHHCRLITYDPMPRLAAVLC